MYFHWEGLNVSQRHLQYRFHFAISSVFEHSSTEHNYSSPGKILYQLKAHFCLTLLSEFHLICDKGSRINYVFNLASDSYRDMGPFFLVGLSVTSLIDLDGNYKIKPKKVVEQADNK